MFYFQHILENTWKRNIRINKMLQEENLRVVYYEDSDEFDLNTTEWGVIIVQSESLYRVTHSPMRMSIAILDEVNAILSRQTRSGFNSRETFQALETLMEASTHVIAMDAFICNASLNSIKAYRGDNIRIFDNIFQLRIGEVVEITSNIEEAQRIGVDYLRTGRRVCFAVMSCKKTRAISELINPRK
jgi:hypothetical protein